jgi:hypothetical protein
VGALRFLVDDEADDAGDQQDHECGEGDEQAHAALSAGDQPQAQPIAAAAQCAKRLITCSA